MFEVTLIAQVVQAGVLVKAFTKDLSLTFVPQIGMKIQQGTSTLLWETIGGQRLSPAIEEVTYHLDQNSFVCLFTVDDRLKSSIWEELDPTTDANRSEMQYLVMR